MTWANLDAAQCPCDGFGWAEVDLGVWKECPIHFAGQVHPETSVLLLDEPDRLSEEIRRNKLKWQITQERDAIYDLQLALKERQAVLAKLEHDLISRTPTVRAMHAVPSVSELDEVDWTDVVEELT
jgi:hypothetical protein